MARRAPRLLSLALCVAGAATPPPVTAQHRPVQVPIAGRAGVDSLARLGFEVADVRERAGTLYAVIVASPGAADVSENPVRGDQVVISWPAGSGTAAARLAVFAFTGEQLHAATIPAPTNEYVWDLRLGGSGRRVVNGAYIVVVEVEGRRYRRRLFVARGGGGGGGE